jgi:tripartite-type tricarboxylate transporter receptor subunit TctC
MVTNRQRSPLVPDVPTAEEAGFPELTFSGVVGFFGGRDLQASLRDRIAGDVSAVGNNPGGRRRSPCWDISAILRGHR